jgi:hypothetical protein
MSDKPIDGFAPDRAVSELAFVSFPVAFVLVRLQSPHRKTGVENFIAPMSLLGRGLVSGTPDRHLHL